MKTHRACWAFAFLALAVCAALPVSAATIGIAANVSHQPTPGGGNATRVNGNGLVINNSLNPFIQLQIAVTTSQGDHQGVSQIVYDVVSPEAKSKGYFLDDLNLEGNTGAYRAWSGYNNFGGPVMPRTILAATYVPGLGSVISNAPAGGWGQQWEGEPDEPATESLLSSYAGGWGWTNSGLPHWGRTADNPGSVLGAGDSLPLTWSGDLDPNLPGSQSFARIGIGIGAYTALAEDPVLGGQTLGFGTDIANGIGGGDGSWWFHTILIDTTGWDKQEYTFNLTTTAGNVLRPDVDLSQPLGGGFRQSVLGSDLHGTSISFTLIPEPATLGLLLLGALALVRRRA